VIDFDEELRQRFAALVAADGGDWGDVVRRARRKRMLPVAAVVAVFLVAVALATAASGLERVVIDWFETEQAAPRTELAFSTLDEGAPPGLETRVIPGTARKAFDVALPEGMRATVWLAPTAGGGFCELMKFFDADGSSRGAVGPGCDDRRGATGFGFAIPGPISRDGVIERGPVVIDGRATISDAAASIIRFQDGREVEIPLTWVSKPIDAGFFVYGVPPANWKPGRQPVELRYIDVQGNVLGRTFAISLAPR
jgi:hypothetical protein